MKTGIELITEERKEQIEKHGWNVEDDESYNNEELLKAALFCVDQKQFEWPWNWLEKYRTKITCKNRVDQLKVAGALIAAEIDRIQYKSK
jgi:transposase